MPKRKSKDVGGNAARFKRTNSENAECVQPQASNRPPREDPPNPEASKCLKLAFVVGEYKYRFSVCHPVPDSPIKRVHKRDKASREVFRSLLKKLKTEHIARRPNPTATLVDEDRKGGTKKADRRIDTQSATAVWRNIHYQEGHLSFAAVTVDHGAEFCYAVGYEKKLLSYVRRGLDLSFENSDDEHFQHRVYRIHVKMEKKRQQKQAKEKRQNKKYNENWEDVRLDKDDLEKLHDAFVNELRIRKNAKKYRNINREELSEAMNLSPEQIKVLLVCLVACVGALVRNHSKVLTAEKEDSDGVDEDDSDDDDDSYDDSDDEDSDDEDSDDEDDEDSDDEDDEDSDDED